MHNRFNQSSLGAADYLEEVLLRFNATGSVAVNRCLSSHEITIKHSECRIVARCFIRIAVVQLNMSKSHVTDQVNIAGGIICVERNLKSWHHDGIEILKIFD